MPVFVDTNRCPCATPCFPSKMCPYDVLHFNFDAPTQPATLDPQRCGDCKGICTNFCDPHALHFAPTMDELKLAEAEFLGTMSAEEASAERKKLKEQAAAASEQTIVDVTTASFEQEVLRAALPVVIDCWAPWCGPCKAFAPVFSQVAHEYRGRVKFCKINTDTETPLAQAMRIQSIPTLVVFSGGQPLGAIPGAMSAAQLRSTIEQVLQSVGSTPPADSAPAASAAPHQQQGGAERVPRGKNR